MLRTSIFRAFRFPIATALLAAGLVPGSASANLLTNGGFEAGNLSSWTAGGSSVVQALQPTGFNPNIATVEGSWFALLSTGPGDRGGPTGDVDGNGTTEFDIVTLSTSFTTTVASTLSFSWDFLTSEANEAGTYDDVFEVTLGGTRILSASVRKQNGDISPFPNTGAYNGTSYTVTAAGATNGSTFGGTSADGRTGFNAFSFDIATPGTYTLLFRLGDQTDRLFDTGILLDDVQVRPNADLSITKTDGVSTVTPGQAVTYTLVVSNAGPAAATGATVTDTFPGTLTGVTWTCVAAGGASCTASGSGNLSTSVNLPVGGTATFTVNATVSVSATGTISNTATVTAPADLADPSTANNSATDVDTVLGTGNITQITGSSGSNVVVKNGGLEFSMAGNHQVTASDDASVIAFVSNANYTGGNADLGNEVFVWTSSGIVQITSVTAPVAYSHAASPNLSMDGRYLVFESTADLTGGNADWNREIFLYDRNSASLQQITTSSGCGNRLPTVSLGGNRVAFVTDCSNLASGFNADRNDEVVVWNGGSLATHETTGCDSQSAVIDRNNLGRFVTFVSSCNYRNTNGDGNRELFQWRWQNDTYTQFTTSANPVTQDVPWPSDNGRYVSFVSTGNYSGQNADGSLEVFRYDRNSGSFSQLTNTPTTTLHTHTRLEPNGRYLAVERLDLLTFQFSTLLIDANTSTTTTLVAGDSTLPVVGVQGGVPVLAFESGGDYTGGNADGNVEIWTGRTP